MGQRINEYTEIAEVPLHEDSRIYLRAGKNTDGSPDVDKYDEKSARQHIKKTRDLLSGPMVLTSSPDPKAAEAPVTENGVVEEEAKEPAEEAAKEGEKKIDQAQLTQAE